MREYGERVRVPFKPVGKSLTKQAFQEESDINAIMRKYTAGGLVSYFNRQEPRYGDFTSASDYREACNKVLDAQQMFDALPVEIRDHCKNDPAELLAMAFDPERRAELEKFGLVAPGAPVPASGAPAGGVAGSAAPVDTPAGVVPPPTHGSGGVSS